MTDTSTLVICAVHRRPHSLRRCILRVVVLWGWCLWNPTYNPNQKQCRPEVELLVCLV